MPSQEENLKFIIGKLITSDPKNIPKLPSFGRMLLLTHKTSTKSGESRKQLTNSKKVGSEERDCQSLTRAQKTSSTQSGNGGNCPQFAAISHETIVSELLSANDGQVIFCSGVIH